MQSTTFTNGGMLPISGARTKATSEADVNEAVPNAEQRTAVTTGAQPAAQMLRSGRVRQPVDCGDLPFLIQRDGTWLYRGSPIVRKEMVCLFSSVLKRDADGDFWLETPAERGRIEVEDAPFVAVELDWSGVGRDQTLTFRTNVDQLISAGPEHPIRIAHDMLTCEPTPYILVRARRRAAADRGAHQPRGLLRTGRAGRAGDGAVPPHAGRLEPRLLLLARRTAAGLSTAAAAPSSRWTPPSCGRGCGRRTNRRRRCARCR